MIRVGDRVKFMSDTGAGVVTSIKGAVAHVLVEDGFEVPAQLSDLVVVSKEDELEAIRKIGVDEERPGVGKGATQKAKGEKEERRKRPSAMSRYGKVSLVDDEEDEEEIVDIARIKEQYLRNMAAVNDKELAMEQDEFRYETKKEEDEDEAEEPKMQEPEKKMKTVGMDELDKMMKEKIRDKAVHPIKVEKSRPHKGKEIEVIDLHVSEILPSTDGLMPGEILSAQMSRFTIALDLAIKSGKHGKIVFIHGVGSGKLKYELQKELKLKYPKIQYQNASFAAYGYGAILVFY